MDVKAYDRKTIKKIRDEVLEEFKKNHEKCLPEMLSSMLDVEDSLVLELFILKLFKK